jgi:tRNA-binding EMAP/Myf-like protein
MIGKNFTFVVNLEYRNILDMESQAMILACHDKENDIVSALVPDKDVSFGSSVN